MNDDPMMESPSADIEKRLHQAKLALQAGRIEESRTQLSAILDLVPAHRDGLYYLAVCQRKFGNATAAQATLDSLMQAHPQYGRAYQEQAYNHLSVADKSAALLAFRRAVELNPTLVASWQGIAELRPDDQELLQRTGMHLQWLSKLPPQLLTVHSLIHENKLFVAEQLCRKFLQKQPQHVEGMRLLAEIASKLQILDDAEILLENCVAFAPEFQRGRLDYVQVLHKRQKFQKALEQAKLLHAADPDNIANEITLASEHQAVGLFDDALSIYSKIIERKPDLHSVHSAQGHALKTIGRTDEAIESYRNAYRCKADFGDAYWSLANLKTYRFTDAEMAGMREQVNNPATDTDDRVHLCFALGKALEDQNEYSESFKYYDLGNHLKQQQSRYTSERIEQEFEQQKSLFDAEFFEQRRGFGCQSPDPVFIVGLPRAGSTLLEQILASHSQVDGTMELANIIGLAHRLHGRRAQNQSIQYPAILAQLEPQVLQKFGEDFISDTRFHRAGGAFFIDKMPNNFRHIGLIHLILPNAKIIDARRHPMACCFGGFKQLFAEGQEFSYGQEPIGRYYRAYVDLMRHWDQVLPGRVLRVQHEDVIDDLETQVRRILDYCELPFEQSCVDYHKTDRAVRTPSSEQVRQPIYKTGMNQWQRYDEFLDPLRESLGPALSDYS